MRPEAGWYPDPSDSAQLRWWDGAAWTQDRTPAAGAVPVYPPEEPSAPDLTKRHDPEPAAAPAAGQPAPASPSAPSGPVGPSAPVPPVAPSAGHSGYTGAAMAACGRPLAHQGWRLVARMIDWVVLFTVQWILTTPWRGPYLAAYEQYLGTAPSMDPFALMNDPAYLEFVNGPEYASFLTASLVVGLLSGLLYEVLMLRYKGATVGKLVCRIQVVPTRGGQVGWWQAVGRWAAVYPLAQITCYLFALIDSVWCLFDADRECLHDKMAGTQVISRG